MRIFLKLFMELGLRTLPEFQLPPGLWADILLENRVYFIKWRTMVRELQRVHMCLRKRSKDLLN